MSFELLFLRALFFTTIIELVFLVVIVRKFFRIDGKEISNAHLFFIGFLASLTTLPYLWFLFPFFIKNTISYVVISELFAILLETVIYYFGFPLNFKKALFISTICNLFSYLAGVLFS
jgi:hypothetical protein